MSKTLLVSGAGGGLGSQVAISQAKFYSEMLLLGRDLEKLSKTAKAVREAGCTPHLLAVDLSDHSAIKQSLSPFKKIDAVVNAAAILGPVKKFGEGDFSAWAQAINVNLTGNAALLHHALPKLLSAKRGKIVNFSGGGATGVRLQHSSYAASKSAMVRLTEIIAAEHPSLDCNVIAPGAHKTAIWDCETHDSPPAKWADGKRFLGLVSFLLSDQSNGVTGKFIHINDQWENFSPATSKSELYTLRRVEPKR